MSGNDEALTFECDGAALVGILSRPVAAGSHGVMIVVGGPQYRAGSHRQFTLLARHLAASGTAVLRFDYRGMGDSEGEVRAFDDIHDDLRAAVDAFFATVPSLKSVALWALCDGACAAMFYGPTDPRVSGLVLLNPWVHTETGAARTQLKHYYVARLLERSFWQKLMSGHFKPLAALRSLLQTLAQAKTTTMSSTLDNRAAKINVEPLPDRMLRALQAFQGRVLLITSGRDLTARQFHDTIARSKAWREVIDSPRVMHHELTDADHTFSREVWRDQVANWTNEWIASWKSMP